MVLKKNKKIKNATECKLDGIKFKSKQERSIYKYLLSVGVKPFYESKTFIIWDSEKFTVPFYDKYGKVFQKIERKPTLVRYTPDFIFKVGETTVYLEVKGMKNDVFNYKAKLFRRVLEDAYNETGMKSCYAVVYTIKDLKFLLNDLQSSNENSNFVQSK